MNKNCDGPDKMEKGWLGLLEKMYAMNKANLEILDNHIMLARLHSGNTPKEKQGEYEKTLNQIKEKQRSPFGVLVVSTKAKFLSCANKCLPFDDKKYEYSAQPCLDYCQKKAMQKISNILNTFK